MKSGKKLLTLAVIVILSVLAYPVHANSAPTFTSVSDSPDPTDTETTVKSTTVASDIDEDMLNFYVCKSNDGTSSGCGAGGIWCSNITATTNPMCTFTAPAIAGTYTYYAYLFDQHNAAASGNPKSGTFTAAKSNGAACTLDSQCLSNNCAADYDGAGAWCEPTTSCAHNGVEYVNGAYAPDCYDSKTQRTCSAGTWITQGCGVFKKCIGGTCADSDDDNDGVLDANDKCPDTPGTCTAGNGKINSTNGCPFVPFNYVIKNDLSESCPSSSIPVDPENAGCLSATDASKTITLKLGSYIANPSCDTIYGTDGWHDAGDGRNYCEFKIDGTVPVGMYNLHSVFSINGVNYDQTFKSGFSVTSTCSTSSGCSHGGHMTAAPTAALSLSPPCILSGGKYVCKLGTTAGITGISSVVPQCSDGVVGGAVTPGVIAWLYSESVYKNHSSNSFAGCATPIVPVPMKYRTDLLLETSGLLWPCDIGWSSGGSTTAINSIYTFSSVADAGTYTVYLDYINAICDSPDYICPTNGGLCAFGSMSGDYWGFENFAKYNMTIVNPDMSFTSAPENPYMVPPDQQDETISLQWIIKNIGVGDINVTVSPNCTGITCTLVLPVSKTAIPQGETITAIMTVPLACSAEDYTKNVGISVEYQDSYGLNAKATKTNITAFTVVVPKPDLSIVGSDADTVRVDGALMHFISTKVKNNGTGGKLEWNKANISASAYLCPDPLDCPATVIEPLVISLDESAWINITLVPGCYESVFINISYDDIYGLSCIPGRASYIYNATAEDKLMKAEGCACASSDECGVENLCLRNLCVTPKPPVISPAIIGNINVLLGAHGQMVVNVKNPLIVDDIIELSIVGNPQKLHNWLWFDGHKHDENKYKITIDLAPKEEKTVAVEIFGGEATVGWPEPTLIRVIAKSSLIGLTTEITQAVSILYSEDELTVQTPEFGWMSFIWIAIAGALLTSGCFPGNKEIA